MPEDTKPWWRSKGVIGGTVAMVLPILAAFGIGGLADQGETITQLVMQIAAAVAGAIAVYGRVVATKKLK